MVIAAKLQNNTNVTWLLLIRTQAVVKPVVENGVHTVVYGNYPSDGYSIDLL